MSAVRQLVHRGVVDAAAYLFGGVVDRAEAERRVLARWTHGSTAYAIDDGLLLCLPKPERVRASLAPGAPLVSMHGMLVAAPIEPAVLEKIHTTDRAVVLVKAGRIVVAEADDDFFVDPSHWIDVTAFSWTETKTLGALPRPIQVEPLAHVDLRDALSARVPAAAPELDAFRRLLAARLEGKPDEAAENALPKIPFTDRLRSIARGLKIAIDRLFAFGTSRARPATRRGTATRTTTRKVVVHQRTTPSPSPAKKTMREILAQIAARLTRVRALRIMLGKRQADYIANMIDAFERGDLDRALRHAIPLGDFKKETPPTAPALGVPKPRTELAITSRSPEHVAAIGMPGDVYADLRRMYQRAFERLEREGRYEEAAFVLAELLQETEAAVLFLERHGFLVVAAELAESRRLPAPLVVRQWFVAGRIQRAIRIARRTGAFQEAVLRLEQSDPRRAELLRMLWADALADAGDFSAAVEVVWRMPYARHVAVPWINQAIDAGGPGAARMIVKAIALLPHAFASLLEKAREIVDDEREETSPVRAALAIAILREPDAGMLAPIARGAARAILRDAARRFETLAAKDFDRLVERSKDGILRADLCPFPQPPTAVDLDQREHPRTTRVARTDTGVLQIADVAFLPNGRLLVALGEAGVRVLSPDGRKAAHFNTPAHQLVVSDHGDRAIALAHRGALSHLSRIDLVRRRATPWCERMLGTSARDFDGSIWFVVERTREGRDSLIALDATSSKTEALWRLEEERRIFSIARSTSNLSALMIDDDSSAESWTWDLPSLALRRRAPTMFEHQAFSRLLPVVAIEPGGLGVIVEAEMGSLVTVGEEDQTLRFDTFRRCLFCGTSGPSGIRHLGDIPIEARIGVPEIDARWLLVPMHVPRGATLRLYDVGNTRLCATIDLDGAMRVSVRMCGAFMVAADDRGRILVFERRQGRLIRSLRI
jgi:hypothetical protein